MKLSIIIPVYNEQDTVATIIEEVKMAALPPDIDREIIVVNDGSKDNTAKELDKYSDSDRVRIFHKEKNEGKTSAIVRGFKEATGDLLLIQDADLEYSPKDYPVLLDPILKDEADVVYGSRFLGKRQGVIFINGLANALSNITFVILYWRWITDINTCYKLFKKETLKDIHIESAHFTFETEITAKMLNRGYRIKEVPISYKGRDRSEGKKINAARAWDMYWGMFKYRFKK